MTLDKRLTLVEQQLAKYARQSAQNVKRNRWLENRRRAEGRAAAYRLAAKLVKGCR
jgi:hypothetical protein